MPTHNFTYGWSRNGESISRTIEVTAPGEKNFDVSLTSGQANKLYEATIDVSTMKSLIIDSPADDITLKTNSSGSPAQTLTIKAGEPLVWCEDSGLPNPLTTDVTAFYLSTAATRAVTAKIRILEDVTV